MTEYVLELKNINKYPSDAIAAFGKEVETGLCDKLRKVAYEDDYFEDVKIV